MYKVQIYWAPSSVLFSFNQAGDREISISGLAHRILI